MRKLGLISSLWAALLFFPLTGNALGLGEIEISSFLNQPLKAEIPVISARPGEVDDLLISLASRDAFQKAGLDRPAELSKLRFNVEKSDDGQSARILVSTKTPVVEPFLSFLVEADWAKGRVLREFTVLLDPPSFAQQAVVPAAQLAPEPQQQQEPASNLIARKAPAQQQTAAKPANSQQLAPEPIAMTAAATGSMTSEQIPLESAPVMSASMGSPSQVVVNRGDTLWRISSNLKDKQHSVAQMMLALQMMNPDAFGNDNINNLRIGSVLRIPDRDMMNKLSKQEAHAQVLDQNGLWDDYLARKSGSTSKGTPGAVAGATSGAKKKPTGQLTLVAPGDGKSTNASLSNEASSTNSNQLRKKLALAEEELEAARLKNNDLNSRVGILEQQLKKFEELQKLVQIQDNSLAQLQQSVSDPASVKMPEKMAPVVKDMQKPLPAEDEKPTSKMITAAGEMMANDGLVKPVEAKLAIQDGVKPEMPLPPVKAAESGVVPAPIIVTEVSGPVIDEGFMDMLPSLDELLNDPVMLGGLGGVLALLLGFLFLKKKKSSADEAKKGITLEEPEDLTDDDPTPIHVPSVADDANQEDMGTGETAITQTTKFNALADLPESEEAEEEEDQFARTAIISAEDMPEMEDATAIAGEQDDVLNEVDVYLAYGLYDNAEDLLKESLENSPDRADYRAKLLDTYFATKNSAAFVKEATLLKSLGKAANRFWDRVQVMGHELAPENDLFSGAEGKQVSLEELAYAKPASADFDISSDDDALNFSETDFDLSGDSQTDSFDLSATQLIKSTEGEESPVDELDVIDIDFPELDEDEEEDISEINDLSGLSDEPVELEIDDSDSTASIENVEQELKVDELGDSDDLDGFDLDDEIAEEVEEKLAEKVNPDEIDFSDESLSFDLSEEVDEIDDGFVNVEDVTSDDEEIDLTGEDVSVVEEIDITGEDVSVVEEIQLDPTLGVPSVAGASLVQPEGDSAEDIDDDEVEFSFNDDVSEAVEVDEDELDNATQLMTASDLTTESGLDDEDIGAEIPLEEGLDFDMSDIDEDDLQTGGYTPSAEDTLSEVKLHADDITEFKPADFTGEFGAIDDRLDDAAIEVDTLAGLDKTGTFAPGDFNEESTQETAAAARREIDEIDDIEDLMLPDDVDEVGTKLDLAKAFIDMGDVEGARSSLEEVLVEGTDEQIAEANELISQIN